MLASTGFSRLLSPVAVDPQRSNGTVRTAFAVAVRILPALSAALLLSGCVSHLKEAKLHYTRAQAHVRAYRGGPARAAYLKAMTEAALEIRRHPSAQAHLLRGMAELGLERWMDAAASFRRAFTFGFERGEAWAEDLALFGLAVSFSETGLEQAAESLLARLVAKSRSRPVIRLAARGYAERILARTATEKEADRERLLRSLLKTANRLADQDPACGFHRYLVGQVCGHLAEYHRGFEAAVMARELGLPTPELLHDNDNQIIFFRGRLREILNAEEWAAFESRYVKWIERWEWPGPETPSWRKR